MAQIIPSLGRQTLARMTSGERRVARCLESLLDDSYLVWYDIPIGAKRRYPDFIVLHPYRGILFLEVKDWKTETLQKISKTDVTLLTNAGLVTTLHPLEQVRQSAYAVIDQLSRDPLLCHQEGAHRGKLIFPYGWGVVFTKITRRQMEQALSEDVRASVLPDHLVIYKEEVSETGDAEKFQEQLWNMFHYHFGGQLTLPQIDRIRWHLFPEIRIDTPRQGDIFAPADESTPPMEQAIPDIIRIMDIQQEQLARSLGEGHRVIHGVAGSGKTMILGYRCLYLAQALNKPILVLCFNSTLAAKLRSFLSTKGIGGQVQVYHFHDWCGQQLKSYHVQLLASAKPYWERQVDTVIDAVEKGHIPRGQYGAVLIDEGNDFEAEWLKLIVQMVDRETNALLLLYDDAQTVYKKQRGLGFPLSSVGIQAQGRTTVLRLNYRNTREILQFAYSFARLYIEPGKLVDGEPIIEPEAAGNSGPPPVVRGFKSLDEEIDFTCTCLVAWHNQGVAWNEMAVLCAMRHQGDRLAARLKKLGVPCTWLDNKQEKKNYDPAADGLVVLTIHSSKGLEFPRVIMLGIGQMDDSEERREQDARLLYVGMTRAQQCLLITTSGHNDYSKHLAAVG